MNGPFRRSVIAGLAELGVGRGKSSSTCGTKISCWFSGGIVASPTEFSDRICSGVATIGTGPRIVGYRDNAAIGRVQQSFLLASDDALAARAEKVGAIDADPMEFSSAGQDADQARVGTSDAKGLAQLWHVEQPAERATDADVSFFGDMSIAIDDSRKKGDGGSLWRVKDIGSYLVLLAPKMFRNPFSKC